MSPKPSNQSGGQTHGWILFNFVLSIISVLSLFFVGQVVFTVKTNSPAKNRVKSDIIQFYFEQDPSMRLPSREIIRVGSKQVQFHL